MSCEAVTNCHCRPCLVKRDAELRTMLEALRSKIARAFYETGPSFTPRQLIQSKEFDGLENAVKILGSNRN